MQLTSRVALGILLLVGVAGFVYLIRQDADQSTADVAPINAAEVLSTRRINEPDGELPAESGARIPIRYVFMGNARIPRAENDDTLLASYSAEQQSIIRSFYAQFGDTGLKGPYLYDNMFAFRNQRQLDWMANNGYPMPDDILAAAHMASEELLTLANKGNIKAKALLLVREYQQQGSGADSSESDDLSSHIQLSAFQNDLLMDGSAFAGYVWAAKHMTKPTVDGRAGVIAGYAFAQTMGDDRASVLSSAFAKANPGMDPVEAVASYRAMLMTAIRNPQLSNLSNLMRRPNFQMY